MSKRAVAVPDRTVTHCCSQNSTGSVTYGIVAAVRRSIAGRIEECDSWGHSAAPFDRQKLVLIQPDEGVGDASRSVDLWQAQHLGPRAPRDRTVDVERRVGGKQRDAEVELQTDLSAVAASEHANEGRRDLLSSLAVLPTMRPRAPRPSKECGRQLDTRAALGELEDAIKPLFRDSFGPSVEAVPISTYLCCGLTGTTRYTLICGGWCSIDEAEQPWLLCSVPLSYQLLELGSRCLWPRFPQSRLLPTS